MRHSKIAGVVLAIGLAGGCASTPAAEPHPGLEKRWSRYLSMHHQRAFAISGDPAGQWIGSMVGGLQSPSAAEREALKQCEEERVAKDFASPCKLYATGHRIVWDDPPGGS